MNEDGPCKGRGKAGILEVGVENIEVVVSTRVLVVESKIWQLIDFSGKDKGRAKKVCHGFKSQCP